MNTARLVFVSTPYAGINRKYYAKKIALQACEIVKQNGYEPISPVLAFMDVYGEPQRDKIMRVCEELLRVCSYYYYHDCEAAKHSQGMAAEAAWAKEYSVTELKFSLFDE